MEKAAKNRLDTKKVFRTCGTCSRTFAHLLNREFGHPKEQEELALNPLAGGIMNQGYQCGMLWGASLAVGAESYRKHQDPELAMEIAILTTQDILDSFTKKSKTINCKEIIGYDLNNVVDMAKFMLKTTLKGINNSQCFNLADEWAPEAIQSGRVGLSQNISTKTQQAVNCASEVVKKMGGSEEERVMVSGFAGGLGLSGNACGALSAAIWMKTLNWCRKNPGKNPPYFRNATAKKMLNEFHGLTGSKMLCNKISGRYFNFLDDHSTYIKNGGCKKLLNALARS